MDVFCEFRLPESYPPEYLPIAVKQFVDAALKRHSVKPLTRHALKSMAREAGLDPSYTPLDNDQGLVGMRLDHRGEQIPMIVRFEALKDESKTPSRCPNTLDMFEV